MFSNVLLIDPNCLVYAFIFLHLKIDNVNKKTDADEHVRLRENISQTQIFFKIHNLCFGSDRYYHG